MAFDPRLEVPRYRRNYACRISLTEDDKLIEQWCYGIVVEYDGSAAVHMNMQGCTFANPTVRNEFYREIEDFIKSRFPTTDNLNDAARAVIKGFAEDLLQKYRRSGKIIP